MRKINKLARIAGTVAIGGAAAVSALAITPGTFGGFTSSSSNPGNSVTAGTLTMTNSASGAAVITAAANPGKDNMKPGDSVSGSVTITNSGSLPANMTLSISHAVNTFPSGDVNLVITDGATQVYSGSVADTSSAIALGSAWAAGASHTYTVTVSIPSTADNDAQGKGASFELDWNGAQS
jgi:spore coat-associated protein N